MEDATEWTYAGLLPPYIGRAGAAVSFDNRIIYTGKVRYLHGMHRPFLLQVDMNGEECIAIMLMNLIQRNLSGKILEEWRLEDNIMPLILLNTVAASSKTIVLTKVTKILDL